MGSSCLQNYSRVCSVTGTTASVVGLLYLLSSLLMRFYVDGGSLQYFETLPTYVPAITYLLIGLSTLAFAFESHRSYMTLKLTSLLALVNTTLSCILTLGIIFTNVKIFMAINIESCENQAGSCKCTAEPFSPAFPKAEVITFHHHEGGECTFPIAVVSACFFVLVTTSIFSVFLSIFMWRLLQELE